MVIASVNVAVHLSTAFLYFRGKRIRIWIAEYNALGRCVLRRKCLRKVRVRDDLGIVSRDWIELALKKDCLLQLISNYCEVRCIGKTDRTRNGVPYVAIETPGSIQCCNPLEKVRVHVAADAALGARAQHSAVLDNPSLHVESRVEVWNI